MCHHRLYSHSRHGGLMRVSLRQVFDAALAGALCDTGTKAEVAAIRDAYAWAEPHP